MMDMDKVSLRERIDAIAVFGFAGVIFLLTGLNWHGLREFSSVVSVVCFMILTWRIIGDIKQMTHLSLLLSTCLALNLGTSAVAQYLLARPVTDAHPLPNNTLGLLLVLVSRLFVLFVVVTWNWWLADEREVSRNHE